MFSLNHFGIFLIGIIFLNLFIIYRFKRTAILEANLWKNRLWLAIAINSVCFYFLTNWFYSHYGFVVDDINYYYGALQNVDMGLFGSETGTQFMIYLVKQVNKIVYCDLPSFHIIFFFLGLIGSLNLLYLLTLRLDFYNKANYRISKAGFWSMVCFPNFLAWGRFFGKDSLIFFLAALFSVYAYRILSQGKLSLWNIIKMCVCSFFIYKIRPPIAGFIGISFMTAYLWQMKSIGLRKDFLKFFIAFVVLVFSLVLFTSHILQKATGGESVNIENIQATLIAQTHSSAYGGSATDLAEILEDDPALMFGPQQIFINILNLLFAPMPWQLRGGQYIPAIISNCLLFFLMFKYAKKVKLYDFFQKYLWISVITGIALLSFITGNMGIIMRLKLIILPPIFLLLFSRKVS